MHWVHDKVITIEHIQALESRIEKALALITSLRNDNAGLKASLSASQSRAKELEDKIADFQKDQARIEAGIIEALKKLDQFEDSVHSASDTELATNPGKPEAAPEDLDIF